MENKTQIQTEHKFKQ